MKTTWGAVTLLCVLGCQPAASPTRVDLAVLELRARARAAEIDGLKERAKADSRHNPTRMAIDLDGLQERLIVLRRQLDILKAAGPEPAPETVADFDRAHDDLAMALREYKERYGDPVSPKPGS